MPDWFYRTVSRPMLFRLPPALSRKVALGLMGTLARLRPGRWLIDLLGHMRPDRRLRRGLLGRDFDSPVGIGYALDGDCLATAALARFGIGFIEVGPIMWQPHAPDKPMERQVGQQALWLPDPPETAGAKAWPPILRRISHSCRARDFHILLRLTWLPGTTPQEAVEQFVLMMINGHGCVLALPVEWTPEQKREVLRGVLGWFSHPSNMLILAVSPDLPPEEVDALVEILREVPHHGVLVEAETRQDGGRLVGPPAREAVLHAVQRLRQRWGDSLALIGGGVHEPEDALNLIEAGANLILLDTGLIYSGPGLPKRVNEAILYSTITPSEPPPCDPVTQQTWFWTTLLGISMFFGGLLALGIATTRVVLPYDEAFVGLSRAEMAAVNPRLLAFLTHDRVSLVGTMIAVGAMYLQLSLFGVRRGLHWARVAILSSAFAGFATFFLFLGFGYLEPFHAFVTAILFQFLLFALYSRQCEPQIIVPPNLREDWRWRLSQWGQFLFVLHGCILLGAGLTISCVGVTHVFVHEDLEFMQTTADELIKASPRLLPMIAHDRATFGGMLISAGVVVLLSALWGFRQGDAWLWWGLLGGGGAAYTAAIGVHLAVGYTNWLHLLPAFGGAGLLAAGLAFSYPYLCGPPQTARQQK